MLTNEQIEKLYTFCSKRYINYYDVQVEVVDHLANAIEESIAKDPSMNFDQALEIVYHSFGGYKGLQKVQEQKKKVVQAQNSRLMLKIFMSYFKWPKLAFTLLVVLCCYLLATLFDPKISQVIVQVLINGVLVWEVTSIGKYQHKMYLKRKNLLLLRNHEFLYFVAIMVVLSGGLAGTLSQSLSPELSGISLKELVFYIFLPIYIITLNSYKYYVSEVYKKAIQMYPELFRSTAKA